MSKSIQSRINNLVQENYYKAMCEYRLNHSVFKRLLTCTAEVCETESYYVLRSYNTIVAVIRKTNFQCYDALRMVYGYTATSSQHISKFNRDYGCGLQKFTYRDI